MKRNREGPRNLFRCHAVDVGDTVEISKWVPSDRSKEEDLIADMVVVVVVLGGVGP